MSIDLFIEQNIWTAKERGERIASKTCARHPLAAAHDSGGPGHPSIVFADEGFTALKCLVRRGRKRLYLSSLPAGKAKDAPSWVTQLKGTVGWFYLTGK
jgi:hypothetical protein